MKKFLSTYNKIDANNLNLLNDIYDDQIVFCDPAHKIQGITALTDYFEKLYKNIQHISFEFQHPMEMDGAGYVQWTMNYSHSAINKGKNITVQGATFVRFVENGKVIYHQDYFDLGSMLYQHVPVLGSIIKSINRRLGK